MAQAYTTFHVEVAAEIIATNRPEQMSRERRCPLMRSLAELLPRGMYCTSGGRTVTICRSVTEEILGTGTLPAHAADMMFALDTGRHVEPFSFDLQVSWKDSANPI